MPFAVQSDETNALKRKVCENIVSVFTAAGYPMQRQSADIEPLRQVAITCRSCSTPILTVSVTKNGVANIPAVSVISRLASLHPDCPHAPLTLDDQRRAIEEALRVQMENEK